MTSATHKRSSAGVLPPGGAGLPKCADSKNFRPPKCARLHILRGFLVISVPLPGIIHAVSLHSPCCFSSISWLFMIYLY